MLELEEEVRLVCDGADEDLDLGWRVAPLILRFIDDGQAQLEQRRRMLLRLGEKLELQLLLGCHLIKHILHGLRKGVSVHLS